MDETWKWQIIESMFEKGIIEHQLSSFEQFAHNDLDRIVTDESELRVVLEDGKRYEVCFTEPYMPGPCVTENREIRTITPDKARIRDFYYDSPLYVDIHERFIDEKGELTRAFHHRRIMIARIPVMVGSSLCVLSRMTPKEKIAANECVYDKGGYFIIKGKERVLVTQCRNVYNRVVVIQQTNLKKVGCKYVYTAEMRSMSNETGHSVSVSANLSIDNRTITMTIPYVTTPVPAALVLRALGLSDSDIYSVIGISSNKRASALIANMLRDASFADSREKTLDYIGQFALHVIQKDKRVAYAMQVVETEIFPHLGVTASLKEKAAMVGFMLNRLISTAVGLREPDDRDNYTGKRVETSGVLMEELFRTLFKRYMKNLNLQLQRRQDVLAHISKTSSSITQGLRHSFATGSWGVQKNAYIRTGVSQVLSRMSFGATLSHLRRMNLPIGKEGKNAKIRQIHTSQFGFIDPFETPEGQQVGIVLNLSLSTRVTKTISQVIVRETLMALTDIQEVHKTSYAEMSDDTMIKVFLNGVLLGFTRSPHALIERIRYLKNINRIDKSVSAFFDETICIFCDKGRLVRPLFTVEAGQLRILAALAQSQLAKTRCIDWDTLLRRDFIRYVDCGEIEASNVAMTPESVTAKHHYCEIHPSLMLGVCASTIPYPANTQSPRNCYSASMGKQALSMYASSHHARADTVTHVLDYPAKPIAKTKASTYMGFDDMPCGVNAIVAIMCYSGRNQEDSVIMNKAAIDRGLFVATTYRTFVAEEKKRGAYLSETIMYPTPDVQAKGIGKGLDYSKLDPATGIIRRGVRVKKGDVLVGKVLTKTCKTSNTVENVDASVVAKSGDDGTVDRVFDLRTQHGYRLVKVVLSKHRIPEMGDKVASRAGQKGTIGMIFPCEDMPFTEKGIVPDIIINSHCIPSRMTANQLIETVIGKSCVMNGTFADATPFTPGTVNMVDRICNDLHRCGFNKQGLETMTNGMTGEKIDAHIFIGPTYYQRLKHMVSDKIHSRATGSVTMMTHQPLEGRSQEGGLRFGEMERDCMIVHGTATFLKERLFLMSDPYTVAVCKHCKLMTKSQKSCHNCQNDMVVNVNLPYAAKLLFTELQAMGIKIAITPDE